MAIDIFLSILTKALLPILAIVGFGYGLHRWRPLDSSTMVTLNLYFFVPVYLFIRVLESTLSWWDIGQVGILFLLPLVLLGSLVYGVMSKSSLPGETKAALLIGATFANCGNFGIPVAEIAFGSEGGEIHAVIVMFANFSIFAIAYAVLAMGKGNGARSVLNYFRLPYFYCVLVALLIRDLGWELPEWLLACCHTIAAGLIPMALVTLGAQLANQARRPDWTRLGPVIGTKLILLPVFSFAVVWLLGLWPWPGTVLVLASTAPTAINPLLLTMQLQGDTDTMSDCVFWTTLFSAGSVAVWMTILKLLAPDSFL